MLNKILKVMVIVIIFPLFVTCGVMTIGAGSVGYQQAEEQK